MMPWRMDGPFASLPSSISGVARVRYWRSPRRCRGAASLTALDRVLVGSASPRSITVDHGTEFTSRALEDWAYRRGVALDFIHPGKPVQNAHIESFNGRLRDE